MLNTQSQSYRTTMTNQYCCGQNKTFHFSSVCDGRPLRDQRARDPLTIKRAITNYVSFYLWDKFLVLSGNWIWRSIYFYPPAFSWFFFSVKHSYFSQTCKRTIWNPVRIALNSCACMVGYYPYFPKNKIGYTVVSVSICLEKWYHTRVPFCKISNFWPQYFLVTLFKYYIFGN